MSIRVLEFLPLWEIFYGWPWGFKVEESYILGFDRVVDFSYWDNTDKDENVSSLQWAKEVKSGIRF